MFTHMGSSSPASSPPDFTSTLCITFREVNRSSAQVIGTSLSSAAKSFLSPNAFPTLVHRNPWDAECIAFGPGENHQHKIHDLEERKETGETIRA